MGLVQITHRTGTINRVPRGETPVIELQLDRNQKIVSVELQPTHRSLWSDRKTLDWTWTVVTEWRDPGPTVDFGGPLPDALRADLGLFGHRVQRPHSIIKDTTT